MYTNYGVSSHYMLFCRKICFVAIYTLLRRENWSQKLCLWRTSDKYQVGTKEISGTVEKEEKGGRMEEPEMGVGILGH